MLRCYHFAAARRIRRPAGTRMRRTPGAQPLPRARVRRRAARGPTRGLAYLDARRAIDSTSTSPVPSRDMACRDRARRGSFSPVAPHVYAHQRTVRRTRGRKSKYSGSRRPSRSTRVSGAPEPVAGTRLLLVEGCVGEGGKLSVGEDMRAPCTAGAAAARQAPWRALGRRVGWDGAGPTVPGATLTVVRGRPRRSGTLAARGGGPPHPLAGTPQLSGAARRAQRPWGAGARGLAGGGAAAGEPRTRGAVATGVCTIVQALGEWPRALLVRVQACARRSRALPEM